MIEVNVLENHCQFIHMQIKDSCDNVSLLIAIYASPVKGLWRELSRLAANISEPWLIGGYFNAILHLSKRKGSSSMRIGGCSLFMDWFNEYGICELGFKGPKFTWSQGNLFERLDKNLSNQAGL